ncbi:hypothetical protein ACIQF5_21420 [Streptomyces goshikiensis]|uniref:hypothetical protein n=1 Tax=Streptomyces goshikiensis TaxID=1942 RepID=UPI0038055204
MENQEHTDRLRELREQEEERRKQKVVAQVRRDSQERQSQDEARTAASPHSRDQHYAELPRYSHHGIR